MSEHKKVSINNINIGSNERVIFILGPCQLESRDHALRLAEKIALICSANNSKYIFKASYDKANRSSVASQRGVGIDQGLKILEEVKSTFGCPVLTDVHDATQCNIVADVADVIQIPAFLCRQTDLLLAAGRTGKVINVKKGQFLAPWDMKNIIDKLESTSNNNIMLCERGTTFGYNNLVNDFKGIEYMKELGYPVIFDATHSVQQPGGLGKTSGGQRKFVAALAKAACAIGVSGIFIETHNDPDNAPSDGPNMIEIEHLSKLIAELNAYDALNKNWV